VNRLLDYLLLAGAGAIGVLLRAGCATLAVNAAGSFLFGAVYALGTSRLGLPPAWQAIILVGLLGGFTTYSSFAFQAVEMLAQGRTAAALAYIAATNVLALAAAWAGLRLAGN